MARPCYKIREEMKFISYAQNREDVILWRSLKNISKGFYIDVGANDPVIDSVTKAFYDHGWSGINIEPVTQWYDLLCEDRQRDINLNVAAGKENGQLTIYEIPDTGLSTQNKSTAERHSDESGYQNSSIIVPVKTLSSICTEKVSGDIHFLKIDVEGAEKDVLQGIDLSQIRPWIILVEATDPNTKAENYEDWEYLLLDSGYQFVYLDGVNRFYIAKEHIAFEKNFQSPPNFFDNFELANEMILRDRLIEANVQLVKNNNIIDRLNSDNNLLNNLLTTQLKIYKTKEEDLLNQINTIYMSSSWRLTKPIRFLGNGIRDIRKLPLYDSKHIIESIKVLIPKLSQLAFSPFLYIRRSTVVVVKKYVRLFFLFLDNHQKFRKIISSIGKKIGLKNFITNIYYYYDKNNKELQNIENNKKYVLNMIALSPRARKIFFDLKSTIAKDKDHS